METIGNDFGAQQNLSKPPRRLGELNVVCLQMIKGTAVDCQQKYGMSAENIALACAAVFWGPKPTEELDGWEDLAATIEIVWEDLHYEEGLRM